jgi:hypothetical protein
MRSGSGTSALPSSGTSFCPGPGHVTGQAWDVNATPARSTQKPGISAGSGAGGPRHSAEEPTPTRALGSARNGVRWSIMAVRLSTARRGLPVRSITPSMAAVNPAWL